MGREKAVYREIREKYRTKAAIAEEAAAKRLAQLHGLSPELAEVDRRLQRTAADIALATIGVGDAWRENLERVRENNLALQAKRAELICALGYPADHAEPRYSCEKCKDRGYVGIYMCECMRKEMVFASFAASGLGDLVNKQSFDNFTLDYYARDPREFEQMKKNLEIARDFAEQFEKIGKNLLFCGNTGLGKTHLSTSIARRVMERGFDVTYTSAASMFEQFELQCFGNGEQRGTQDVERYTDCDLLIIDDLGTERITSFTVSCLYQVVNDRLNAGRAMIISTNFTPKEIREKYVDRLASRLLGEFSPLLFLGTDVRLQKLMRK